MAQLTWLLVDDLIRARFLMLSEILLFSILLVVRIRFRATYFFSVIPLFIGLTLALRLFLTVRERGEVRNAEALLRRRFCVLSLAILHS